MMRVSFSRLTKSSARTRRSSICRTRKQQTSMLALNPLRPQKRCRPTIVGAFTTTEFLRKHLFLNRTLYLRIHQVQTKALRLKREERRALWGRIQLRDLEQRLQGLKRLLRTPRLQCSNSEVLLQVPCQSSKTQLLCQTNSKCSFSSNQSAITPVQY